MKIPLLCTLIIISKINNIRCIGQTQNQPTSYSSSNIQTQYRQIENYIKSNVVQQQQPNPLPNLHHNIANSDYQTVQNINNYYQDPNNVQSKPQENHSNGQSQLFYVEVDRPSSQVQDQNQRIPAANEQYLIENEHGNQLGNQNIAPSVDYLTQNENYAFGVQAGQEQYAPQPIQQNLKSTITQSQPHNIPLQQQSIPIEQYVLQTQQDTAQNVYQPQPQLEQSYQQHQPQELPQNIPQQYNVAVSNDQPLQTVNYPVYEQVNNEPIKPKQNSGYKVRETPVERQTEEFAPTNNPYTGQPIVRNSQLFHDLAVHGSFNNDGNIFGQLNYQPNQQIARPQPVQQLSQNAYDVFSDSIHGQANMGLSAYGTPEGTPQHRLLNSGL